MPDVKPLSGGVSCEVYLIDDSHGRFVLKRALDKLQTKDDWFADKRRNGTEQRYLQVASDILPGNFPSMVYRSADNFFVMPYLGNDYEMWKTHLMKNRIDVSQGDSAGKILGKIHAETKDNDDIKRLFDTKSDFFDLRIDAYILTTGKRNPQLETFFKKMANDLYQREEVLVHGDYSPKNMLVNDTNMVVIDCETACFGDPSFDTAFLLNHLFLKSVYNPESLHKYMEVAKSFWQSYRTFFNKTYAEDLEERTIKLLPMLMLARVDGKSPAEYITDKESKGHIRAFTYPLISRPENNLNSFIRLWKDSFNSI